MTSDHIGSHRIVAVITAHDSIRFDQSSRVESIGSDRTGRWRSHLHGDMIECNSKTIRHYRQTDDPEVAFVRACSGRTYDFQCVMMSYRKTVARCRCTTEVQRRLVEVSCCLHVQLQRRWRAFRLQTIRHVRRGRAIDSRLIQNKESGCTRLVVGLNNKGQQPFTDRETRSVTASQVVVRLFITRPA